VSFSFRRDKKVVGVFVRFHCAASLDFLAKTTLYNYFGQAAFNPS
jgi:hypothetical protein